MMHLILIVSAAIFLTYAVLEIDYRINKNDPEVKW